MTLPPSTRELSEDELLALKTVRDSLLNENIGLFATMQAKMQGNVRNIIVIESLMRGRPITGPVDDLSVLSYQPNFGPVQAIGGPSIPNHPDLGQPITSPVDGFSILNHQRDYLPMQPFGGPLPSNLNLPDLPDLADKTG
jgi:hypothetical protein